MYRGFFLLGICVLYIETILQIYVIYTTVTSRIVFTTSLVLICCSFVISNMASLVLTLKERATQPLTNIVMCCVLHGLQLGLLWRMLCVGINSDSHNHKIRFIHCGLQTLPFMVIYGSLYLSHAIFTLESVTSLITLFASCISVALAMTSFTLQNSVTHQNKIQTVHYLRRLFGIFLITLGTFLLLASRIGSIVLMASTEKLWVLFPIGCHFFILMTTYMICSEDITWQRRACTPLNLARFTTLSYFNIFDLIESNLRVIQCKYVAFYTLILVENIIMAAVWLLYSDMEYVAKLVTVVFIMVLFVSALISKYSGWCFLSHESETTSNSHNSKFEEQDQPSMSDDIRHSPRETVVSRVRHHSSILRVSASGGSHTTETFISRKTSSSRNFSNGRGNVSKKNNEIILSPKALRGHKFPRKLSKRLKRRLLFGQAQALFHYPKTSTLRSSASVPESFCVSSPNVGDVTDDILNIFRSDTKRVRGRQGFKLGFNRSYLSDGARSTDDNTGHTKLHRTDNYHDHRLLKYDDLLHPAVNSLSKMSASNSYDYHLSNSTTSQSSYVNTSHDESTTRTVSDSSGTNMSLSSDEGVWKSCQKPQFENLNSLPQTVMDSQKRIQNWLSETVSIFDLLYEKSACQDLKPPAKTLCPSKKHDQPKRRHEINNQLKQRVQDSGYMSVDDVRENIIQHDQTTSSSETELIRNFGDPDQRKQNATTDARVPVSTISNDSPMYSDVKHPIYLIPTTENDSGLHINSLDKISQLKQYIYSTEHKDISTQDNSPIIERHFIPIQKHEQYKHWRNKASEEDAVINSRNYKNILKDSSSVARNEIIRNAFSCPLTVDPTPTGTNSLYNSTERLDAFDHKPVTTIESLV
ncbi:uncharacterized protein LOC126819481 [Patella vulgata]|uniref:uncharacterized protein LOC126819481 n=1 Tax=Patella vulgata TaxID=6465 RepID=UPI00218044F5|nr:uncharacterized protein LOC126819481 [Patella vulgata]